MSRVLYISDTHFGHKNICKYRDRFTSVLEHNEFVFDSICSTVTKADNLWILGDIVFAQEDVHYIERIKKYCLSLNIVLGNHDSDAQERQEILKRLIYIADNTHTLAKRNEYWISHYPIHPDELRGKLNIHGHVHSKTIDDNRYINVCCENVGYAPVTYQDIKDGWRSGSHKNSLC